MRSRLEGCTEAYSGRCAVEDVRGTGRVPVVEIRHGELSSVLEIGNH